jgi:MYXO-CTERM domain-containing protein
LGGVLLLYAETLDLYRILTPSGSVSNATGSVRTGSDQHSWAFALMGVAGAAAAVLSRVTRERLPALAAAMLGVIALVVALAVDLPDVTASGVTTDLEVGDAEPGGGFWVELAGALVMTVGAAALASLLPRRREPERARRGATP